MKLTEEEKQVILDKRKQENLEKPQKIAILKHNLYYISNNYTSWLNNPDECFVSKKDINDLIKSIKENFELTITKGTEFVCFIEKNGQESWYDNENYGVECMSYTWAQEHLVNIKNL